VLRLRPGSVIELNRLVNEPVELIVNNRTVAYGEVVVVHENFGLRVTRLADGGAEFFS
jgi:flagellar motor switch protein FliN/FliY